MTSRRLPLVLAVPVATLALACAPDFRPAARQLGQGLPQAREPVRERRTTYFVAQRSLVRREHHVLIFPDGSSFPDGPDVQYFADGRVEYERAFARGVPTGSWRSWWPSGEPRMEATYGTGELQPMRWWHSNGQLSSEGLAREGTKEGRWTFWHANGVKSAEGEYFGGERDASWLFWDESGQPVKRDARARADG